MLDTAFAEDPEIGVSAWIAAVLGIMAIGCLDYFTGIELRVFPLYFVPIGLLAWHAGRRGALFAAALSSALWLASNYAGGMQYSHPAIWLANTLLQAASFVTIGLLIAVLKNALVRERGLSRTDSLTLLMNTRAFYEDAARLLALCRRKGRPATIAYIDLDNFKSVNDTLGHEAGDEVLRRTAALLRECTRESDLCARLGGDEFAIILAESDPRQAAVALERLRRRLAESFAADRCPVTISIGGVTFTSVPEDLDAMVSAADSRMYVAKTAGKNQLYLETVDDGSADPGSVGDEAEGNDDLRARSRRRSDSPLLGPPAPASAPPGAGGRPAGSERQGR